MSGIEIAGAVFGLWLAIGPKLFPADDTDNEQQTTEKISEQEKQ